MNPEKLPPHPAQELAQKIIESKGRTIFQVHHVFGRKRRYAYRVEKELPGALIVRCEHSQTATHHQFSHENPQSARAESILFYMPTKATEIRHMIEMSEYVDPNIINHDLAPFAAGYLVARQNRHAAELHTAQGNYTLKYAPQQAQAVLAKHKNWMEALAPVFVQTLADAHVPIVVNHVALALERGYRAQIRQGRSFQLRQSRSLLWGNPIGRIESAINSAAKAAGLNRRASIKVTSDAYFNFRPNSVTPLEGKEVPNEIKEHFNRELRPLTRIRPLNQAEFEKMLRHFSVYKLNLRGEAKSY